MCLWETIKIILLAFYFLFVINVFVDNILKIKILKKILFAILFIIGIFNIQFGKLEAIIYSILGTIMYFPLMILLNSKNIKYFKEYKYKLYEWLKYNLNNYKIQFNILMSTLQEELIYRVTFIYLMENLNLQNELILFLGTTIFFIIHINTKKKIILLSELEFILFSLIINLVYLLTKSIIAVWLIHYIRNSYIKYRRNLNETN